MMRYLAIGWLVCLGLAVCSVLVYSIYMDWPKSSVGLGIALGYIVPSLLTWAAIEYLKGRQ